MFFKAKVQNCNLKYDDPAHLKSYLARLAKDGQCRVIIKIEKERNKRSIEQNKLYWLDCTAVSDITGYSPEEIHFINKCEYFGVKKIRTREGILTVPGGSSAILNTKEFSIYLENCRHYWQDIFPEIVFVNPDKIPTELYEMEMSWK